MTTSAPNDQSVPAQIIAITNQKGGVGKTTISFNLANYLSELGFKVCVIDLDGQGNISGLLMPGERSHGLRTSMLFDDAPFSETPVTTDSGIDLIWCSNGDMAVYEVEMQGLDRVEVFYTNLQNLVAGYDFVILDTPPTYGVKMISACVSADHIFAPVQMAGFSFDGVVALDSCLATISALVQKEIVLTGLICNSFKQRSIEHMLAVDELRAQAGDLILDTILKDATPIDTAILACKAAWHVRKTGSQREASAMMVSLMAEMAGRLGIHSDVIESFKPNNPRGKQL